MKATHSFFPRPLIFKLQLLKILLGGKASRLRKLKFLERQFFSIVTFKQIFDIPLLVNLFIPLIELPLKTSQKNTEVNLQYI